MPIALKCLRTCCAPCQVDLEQNIAPGVEFGGDPALRASVVVAVHFGPFDEFALLDAGQKVFDADEQACARRLHRRAARASCSKPETLIAGSRSTSMRTSVVFPARWRGHNEKVVPT